MYLTPENAKDYIGMKLYADRHILGCYPYMVFQYPDGTYATEDRAGICSPVDSNPFNQVYFDRAESYKAERRNRMILKDVHKDVERYLAEDCYCPNEVYSVDGFFYQLVFADAECKVIGTYPDPFKDDGKITFVVTASGKKHDHPILLNIWHTAERVTSMERYDYSEHNLNQILRYFKGEISKVRLSEGEELEKSVSKILEHADAILVS